MKNIIPHSYGWFEAYWQLRHRADNDDASTFAKLPENHRREVRQGHVAGSDCEAASDSLYDRLYVLKQLICNILLRLERPQIPRDVKRCNWGLERIMTTQHSEEPSEGVYQYVKGRLRKCC